MFQLDAGGNVVVEGLLTSTEVASATNGGKPAFDDLVKLLQAGDLIYLDEADVGHATHVAIYLGSYGNKDGTHTHLIMDDTGWNRVDSNGVNVPQGVHIRPFTPSSIYYQDFQNVRRWLPELA